MSNLPSETLQSLIPKIQMLEIMGQLNDDASLYRYYYGKGALDLRDKIVEALTDLPFDAPGEVVRQTALSVFPDPFEEPIQY